MPEPTPYADLRAASLGEVAWVDASGGVEVRGVLPLVGAAGPVLALPYADAVAARSLGTAEGCLLVVRDARGTGTAYAPRTLRCRPRLEEDRGGERFVEELLEQELRRYPPSRLLADSLLLRREHAWWLPRLLVHLEVVGEAEPLPREDERDHLLVVDADPAAGGPERLAAASVRLDALPAPGEALPGHEVVRGTPGPGPAVLHGQDASHPDLERWSRWAWRGDWDGVRLDVAEHPARVGLEPVPGLVARWRRQRALEKACRAGLADPA